MSVLLDVIAGNIREILGRRFEYTGSIHINNYQPHPTFLQKLVGYVHADGMYFGYLTVKETLRYYASLKMTRELPYSEKIKKVFDKQYFMCCINNIAIIG